MHKNHGNGLKFRIDEQKYIKNANISLNNLNPMNADFFKNLNAYPYPDPPPS